MKTFFIFLIEDFKNDCKTIKAMIEGKAKLKVNPRELFKWDAEFFKENWLMFLLIILAFLSGYLLGGNIAFAKCDEFITNITNPTYDFINYSLLNFT